MWRCLLVATLLLHAHITDAAAAATTAQRGHVQQLASCLELEGYNPHAAAVALATNGHDPTAGAALCLALEAHDLTLDTNHIGGGRGRREHGTHIHAFAQERCHSAICSQRALSLLQQRIRICLGPSLVKIKKQKGFAGNLPPRCEAPFPERLSRHKPW